MWHELMAPDRSHFQGRLPRQAWDSPGPPGATDQAHKSSPPHGEVPDANIVHGRTDRRAIVAFPHAQRSTQMLCGRDRFSSERGDLVRVGDLSHAIGERLQRHDLDDLWQDRKAPAQLSTQLGRPRCHLCRAAAGRDI